ncbi:hypothetical protein ADL15_12935 [Actinoplanes awajinensis subsp. mycoplanecinus]|uniref:Uncharacterized protein n=2 Tax=Actinoplanes awajinensis TaxID=135946 RepID=A0A0X3UX16_9ACTN|nr:Rv3235 family protein [Actinoplanes awajinensis]KUL36787.1 hypothetical protein ADL15_12935 [Actinoplanes awajinensis subsp. mycoplanecinus]
MRSAVDSAPTGSRPAIHLRPIPGYEPPFDDELTPQLWSPEQQLALEWPRPVRKPSAGPPAGPPVGSPAGRGGPGLPGGGPPPGGGGAPGAAGSATLSGSAALSGSVGRPGGASGPGPAVAPVVAGASGDARLAVKRFLRLCVEVFNGYRPPAHLRRLARPADAAEVVAQGLVGARRIAELRRPRRPGDRRPKHTTPVAVRRVYLCEPRSGAVEVAVALVTGERTWAMALRLELHQDTWCATTLRLI